MKKIVLLSDGTGNGAAKRNRTNVWRLYRALDVHRDDQIAFYDDGVGSQEFLPFKLLGGAFGWGLKRNVLQLYTFLCRNYQPQDRIYLFGFSRGAFTVRLLAGLIDHCGLVVGCDDEIQLNARARKNFAAYRDRYHHGWLRRLFRPLTRRIGALFGGGVYCEQASVLTPDIEFIGVWDTVDAYGLPIDELAVLWDLLIYPMRFADQQLSPKVKRACHALSVDDERLTFHPVLWDEKHEERLVRENKVAPGRIEQVWFPGVHSDVGGGYPMNDLSLVPLDWMMSRVEADSNGGQGLHFIKDLRDQFLRHSNWHGKQHDSRSGLAAYYRYKPRSIARLCNDRFNGISIEKPKIHRAVMERIRGNSVSYAPTGIPAQYEVVATRDSIPAYETADVAEKRTAALSAALDVVYWRRWLYAALVAATVVLLSSRFFLDWQSDGICRDSACAIDPLLQLAIKSLPDFTVGWFEAFRQNPPWLWTLLLAFIVFFTLKGFAWRRTVAKATAAWAALKGYGEPPVREISLTSRLRDATHTKFQRLIHWGPAFIVFVFIIYLLVAAAGHISLYVRDTFGLLCRPTEASDVSLPQSVTFDTGNPCFGTGIRLQQGQTYQFTVTGSGVSDGVHPGGPDGLEGRLPIAYSLGVPLRRELTEPWFKLMARIGSGGNEQLAIGAGPKNYRARSSGELFLFVNDAALGLLPDWAWPYSWGMGPNKGRITVTVSPVARE